MTKARKPKLAALLMLAQVTVVAVGAITPIIVALVVAPVQFRLHLDSAIIADPHVLAHADAAFRSALLISVSISVVLSLIAATIISWTMVHRIAHPIELLAEAAENVADGIYRVEQPRAIFSRELQQLADSFTSMAHRLDETGHTRTRMLADLAHEVRTPLSTLQAYVDGIEDGVITADSEAWDTLHHQINRLRRLADDIREVARAEERAPDLQRIDACASAQSAVRAAAPRYAVKGVTLVLQPCTVACPVDADELRIQQVLGNLLDNALRHTPSGGTVRVAVDIDAAWCRIRVGDTGAGIPQDQLEAVFERFHRVDASRVSSDGSGSGLGLTIARAIALAHGGTLTASSAGLGRGATFELRLPAARG